MIDHDLAQELIKMCDDQETDLQRRILQMLPGILRSWRVDDDQKCHLYRECKRLFRVLPKIDRFRPFFPAIPTQLVPLSVQYTSWGGNSLSPRSLKLVDRWKNIRRLPTYSRPYFLSDPYDEPIEMRWYRGKLYWFDHLASLNREPMAANEVLAWMRNQEDLPEDIDFIALGTRSPRRQVIRFRVEKGIIKGNIGHWRESDRPQKLLSCQSRTSL